MTSTFYIDTNRQNSSVKSKDTNNEWTYKLSNNIQLPAGTEIAIQDTFIHKQGISGSTIEITEDIEETMYFSFYQSDNPQFIPKNTFGLDTRTMVNSKSRGFQPSFCPFGILSNNSTYNPDNIINGGFEQGFPKQSGYETPASHIEREVNKLAADGSLIGIFSDNGSNYYNEPCMQQRVALWGDDSNGRPRCERPQFNNLSDPYIMGYTEQPMMAIYVSNTEVYTDNFGDTYDGGFYSSICPSFNNGGQPPNDNVIHKNKFPYSPNVADHRFMPYVKSVDIFIRSGVYSIGEISDLIENQINGKYVNLKEKDDYYSDTITQKVNNGTFTGTLETSGVYQKVQPLDRWGGNEGLDSDELMPDGTGASVRLKNIMSMTEYNGNQKGSHNENSYLFPDINPTGKRYIGTPFNDRYIVPYMSDTLTTNINYKIANGTVVQGVVPTYLLPYNDIPNCSRNYNSADLNMIGCVKGRKPVLPTEDQVFYIPVHFYNQLIKLWKHSDVGANSASINAYLKKTQNWTINTRRMFRYSFQQKLNMYADSVSSNNGNDTATEGLNNINGAFIGLHTKHKTNTKADYLGQDPHYNTFVVHDPSFSGWDKQYRQPTMLSSESYNYDIASQGYYIGTPDFSFTYDSDMSSYSIKGLHQSVRMPSCDAEGNPISSEGESGAFLKRPSQQMAKDFVVPKRTKKYIASHPEDTDYASKYDTEGGETGFAERIKSCLNASETRVGGIAVYNWAYQTALKYGDIDPKTYTENDGEGNPYKVFDSNYQYLWKFQDFFSTIDKAKEAWEKSLWFRLGFTYDNLQNEESYEKCGYYDLPVDKYSNAGATQTEINANTYFDKRTRMYFPNEDFRVYGKTTNADIGLDIPPTVSTTFNSSLFQYTPTPKSTTDDKNTNKLYQIVRTYDNNDISTPMFSGDPNLDTDAYSDTAITNGVRVAGNTSTMYSYINSMYWSKIRVPVLTESKSIIATKLPQLSKQGYYIITSDILDGYADEIKQGQPLAILGIVPISNLSNQDFITTKNDIVHTTQQVKNLNSVKIKILNPDLTAPLLLENSSVILRITTPLPQNTQQIGSQQEDGSQKNDRKKTNQNPHDNKTQSGR